MVRTLIAPTAMAGAYPTMPFDPENAQFPWTPADEVNGNMCAIVDGKTLLLARNMRETGAFIQIDTTGNTSGTFAIRANMLSGPFVGSIVTTSLLAFNASRATIAAAIQTALETIYDSGDTYVVDTTVGSDFKFLFDKAFRNTQIDLSVTTDTTDGGVEITDSTAGGGNRDLTVTSVPDTTFLRLGDIDAGFRVGDIWVLGPFRNKGWRQLDGNLYFNGEEQVLFAVLTLP